MSDNFSVNSYKELQIDTNKDTGVSVSKKGSIWKENSLLHKMLSKVNKTASFKPKSWSFKIW